MSKGKIAAQAGHATLACAFLVKEQNPQVGPYFSFSSGIRSRDRMKGRGEGQVVSSSDCTDLDRSRGTDKGQKAGGREGLRCGQR